MYALNRFVLSRKRFESLHLLHVAGVKRLRCERNTERSQEDICESRVNERSKFLINRPHEWSFLSKSFFFFFFFFFIRLNGKRKAFHDTSIQLLFLSYLFNACCVLFSQASVRFRIKKFVNTTFTFKLHNRNNYSIHRDSNKKKKKKKTS